MDTPSIGHNGLFNNVTVDPRLLGFPNILTPFAQFTSASRQAMVNHHLSQWMVLDNPEFPKTFTGFEHNMIDYTFNRSRRKYDCEIVEMIPKYTANFLPGGIDDCPQIYVIVINQTPEGPQLDYFEINKYFLGNNGFGFVPKRTNRRLNIGEFLERDATITHSPAVIDDNLYAMGTNLNVVYGSFPETIEDAFIISRSAAEKLKTTQVSKVTLNCRQDRRPLNCNGSRNEDLFLPDIGTTVRPDGLLCGFRPVSKVTAVADIDPESLRHLFPLQDEAIYIEPGAKIVDLTFNVNRSKINNCFNQALRYMENNNHCWELIFRTYLKYRNRVKLSKQMSTLATTAIYRMIAQGHRPQGMESYFPKVPRNFEIEGANRQSVDFLQVEVIYTVPRTVENGDKLTDLHGGKGVIGRIYENECMPIDEFGNRAEIWVDMNSPVARNNPGQFYETAINFISEFARRKIKETYETKGSDPAFDQLMDLYNDINPDYAKLARETHTHAIDRKITVTEAIETSPKILVQPFMATLTPTKNDHWNAIRNVRTWAQKWGAKKSRIRFKSPQGDGTFKEFVTNEEFMIASKYWIHLHKIPEQFAPGPASVNHIGIPTKSTYDTKYFPVSQNPNRFGEDEIRIMSMDTDVREIVRFQNMMSNSPLGANAAISTILNAKHPSAIKRMPISNGDLLASSAIGQLYHGITAALGVETKNTKTDKFVVPEYLSESIWNTNVTEFKDGEDALVDNEDVQAKRDKNKSDKVSKMISEVEEEISEMEEDEEADA